MVRYRYNKQVNPPAPFVHIVLSSPNGKSATADIPAQIDCGADKTVIPQSYVQSLDLIPCRSVQAAGLGRHITNLHAYLVQIAVKNALTIPVEVIAAENENHVLLGRDILNHFRIVLDGPQLLVDVEG